MKLEFIKWERNPEGRPHFEMTVEAWLDSKRRREMSQWMEPIVLRAPPQEPDKKIRFTQHRKLG